MASARTGGVRRFYDVNGWFFIGPALVLIGLFMVYPILWSLWMSSQSGRGTMIKFVGFGNVVRLVNDPVFLHALSNTMIFFIVQVPIMILLALALAAVLNMPKLVGRGLFRTAIFLPCVTSLIAYSALFKGMFTEHGIVNSTLEAIGIIASPIPWLTDSFWAKVLIILAITWRWTGYNMIFYLSAMQNIDKSIYEAARIDGINAWGRFVYITIPLLKPVILFTSVISTIGTLQLFDEVMNITQGGPSDSTLTLSLYIYNLTFKFIPNLGYAATVSYVIVALVAMLAFVQFYAAREKDQMSADRIKNLLGQTLTYGFVGIMSFISVFPFLWMVIGTSNASIDIIAGRLTIGSALWTNINGFFSQVDVPLIFWNSAKIAILSTILTLAVSSFAGYGFEMFKSKMRERVYSAILLTLMIPFAALMIPLFVLMGHIGLINSHIAVLLPTIGSAFIIFYSRQSTKAFPSELRDAAKVDGLKEWQIFLFIYVPVMRSTYAAAFIIVFMTAWNNYLWPLIVLQSNDTKTITLVVSSLASAYYPDFGVVMVGTVLATLPTLVVFFLMQRQFVQGMLGSVK